MGEVLPFLGRYFGVRDWTAAERAQIQSLAKSLNLKAAGIEVVYGASDAGDPWCVIKDAEENVLIHVARIGSNVVVHDMVADLVREGRELWLALERRLADDVLPSSEDMAVHVEIGRREAQLMVALTTASAFGLSADGTFESSLGVEAPPVAPAEAAEELELVGGSGADATALHLVSRTDEPSRDVQGVLAASAPHPSSAGTAPAAEAVEAAPPAESLLLAEPAEKPPEAVQPPMEVLGGGPGDDTIVGSSAAEVIVGGAGDDFLVGGGAPDGQVDVLEGGAGDDRIVVDSDVVAAGGDGADTFLVETPEGSGGGDTNLGVIVDFNESAGDTVKFDSAYQVTITSITPVDDILEGAAGAAAVLTNGAGVSGERIGVDVNGDGVEDGYVLVAVQRGRVILAHGEFGEPVTGSSIDAPSFAAAELAVGGTIWITSEII